MSVLFMPYYGSQFRETGVAETAGVVVTHEIVGGEGSMDIYSNSIADPVFAAYPYEYVYLPTQTAVNVFWGNPNLTPGWWRIHLGVETKVGDVNTSYPVPIELLQHPLVSVQLGTNLGAYPLINDNLGRFYPLYGNIPLPPQFEAGGWSVNGDGVFVIPSWY